MIRLHRSTEGVFSLFKRCIDAFRSVLPKRLPRLPSDACRLLAYFCLLAELLKIEVVVNVFEGSHVENLTNDLASGKLSLFIY